MFLNFQMYRSKKIDDHNRGTINSHCKSALHRFKVWFFFLFIYKENDSFHLTAMKDRGLLMEGSNHHIYNLSQLSMLQSLNERASLR